MKIIADAKRAKELEEEEIRRQEAAARDQADAGSPREETGMFIIFNYKCFKILPSFYILLTE